MTARLHGIAGRQSVLFGIALWPYDLLLRFGYDLPEHEHVWRGEWFDDQFESAALEMRSTAAKLVLAISDMDRAVHYLDGPDGDIERAPLAVDLAACYVQHLVRALAVIVPNCYGQDGRTLERLRHDVGALASSPLLAELDPVLALLLVPPTAVTSVAGITSHTPDAYLERGSALPHSAAHAREKSARATLHAAALVDAALHGLCGWFDALLAHLMSRVAERSEPGDELIERWSDPDWSVVRRILPGDRSLESHLPSI